MNRLFDVADDMHEQRQIRLKFVDLQDRRARRSRQMHVYEERGAVMLVGVVPTWGLLRLLATNAWLSVVFAYKYAHAIVPIFTLQQADLRDVQEMLSIVQKRYRDVHVVFVFAIGRHPNCTVAEGTSCQEVEYVG